MSVFLSRSISDFFVIECNPFSILSKYFLSPKTASMKPDPAPATKRNNGEYESNCVNEKSKNQPITETSPNPLKVKKIHSKMSCLFWCIDAQKNPKNPVTKPKTIAYSTNGITNIIIWLKSKNEWFMFSAYVHLFIVKSIALHLFQQPFLKKNSI